MYWGKPASTEGVYYSMSLRLKSVVRKYIVGEKPETLHKQKYCKS
jgi:hypothetical protein